MADLVPSEDFEALEEAADALLAREAEAVLAEGGPTVTLAELLANLISPSWSYEIAYDAPAGQ